MDGNEHLLLETDSKSRLSIWVVNHANSPAIGLVGDFLHNGNGFNSSDNRLAINKDATIIQYCDARLNPCVDTTPLNPITYVDAVPGSVPLAQSPTLPMLACSAWPAIQTSLQASHLVPVDTFPIPIIKDFSPYDVPSLLEGTDNVYDYIGICKSMKLNNKDFDAIHKGNYIRSFSSDRKVIRFDCTPIPTYDHLGALRMFVLFEGVIFELKSFRSVVRREVYQLPFKPDNPGIWLRDGYPIPGTPIILDTNIIDLFYHNSPGNVGLINAGDIAKLDYELFHGHPIQYVWHHGGIQSRNKFAEAFHFVAEAKKKKAFEVLILQYNGPSEPQKILDLAAARQQALSYGMDIPATLKDTGYVHIPTPQKEFVSSDIPFFWTKGSSTLFFGSGCMVLMKNLLNVFSRVSIGAQNVAKTMPKPEKPGMFNGVFPQKHVAVFYPMATECLTDRLIRKTGFSNVPCISSAILRKEDALETALLQAEIQVLFIVQADELSENDLADVLELCERIGVITGVFSAVEKEKDPEPGDVLKSSKMMELVEQKCRVTANGDSVIVTDTETDKEERYYFGNDGIVSVTEFTIARK